jgi:hypothetical protein
MLTSMLLAALLAGPPAPAPGPAEPGPLAGCKATHTADDPKGSTWVYACDGLRVKVIDETAVGDVEDVARLLAASLKTIAGVDAKLAREHRRIAGREVEVFEASVPGEAPVIAAHVAVPEGTRMVLCETGPGPRCARVIDDLARIAWRAMAAGAVPAPVPELRLGGRRPAVPDGCGARPGDGGGQIVCGEGRAVWREVPDDAAAERAVEQFGAQIVSLAGWSGVPTDRVPCRIAGADVTCVRLVGRDPPDPEHPEATPGRALWLWGWAKLGGRPTFAMCAARGPDALPPPCASVFELR